MILREIVANLADAPRREVAKVVNASIAGATWGIGGGCGKALPASKGANAVLEGCSAEKLQDSKHTDCPSLTRLSAPVSAGMGCDAMLR